jgi:undecaprenyl pyrophosphate synthase
MENGFNNEKVAASNCASKREARRAARRDHHGWERAMGVAAWIAAYGGASGGRRGGAARCGAGAAAGITLLTLYAFSSDNWKRPAFEVRSALALIAAYPRREREALREADARVEAIGRRDRLPRMLLREIEQCEAATATGRRLHLRVAVDYSSREARIRLNPTAPRTSSSPSPAAPACTSSGSSRT